MPSETSIANAALVIIGGRRINSIDDPRSKSALVLRERFDDVRDELLRKHTWNFATTRLSIAEDVTTPAWGYDHQYTLPTDLLRVSNVSDPEAWGYRVESGKILTNIDPPLSIEYVKAVTDVGIMDIGFRQAFAAALAAECAESLTGTNAKVDLALAIVGEKLREARTADSQENSPQEQENGSWLDAREEG